MTVRLLLTDRRRPQSLDHLRGWLGEENLRQLSGIPDTLRYVLIVSTESGLNDPKYLHRVELVSDLKQLAELMLSVLRITEMFVTAAAPIPIDIRFGLEPTDNDAFNRLLDEHERLRLLDAAEEGHA
jgi:hypothetical protein